MPDDSPRPETDALPLDPALELPDDALDADAAEPDAAADPVEQLRADVGRLQDQVLRSAADFQNYRRRTAADLSRARADGRAEAVTQLLDVVDDLTRTVDAAAAAEPSPAAFDALKQGLDLVFQKMLDGLGRLDVQPIAAHGQPFDEHFHEALMQQDAPDGAEPGSVVGVMQPGYLMGERVLRHARVSVAR